MDDWFQNPSLAKDVSLLVVDGAYGFGNGRVLPAGPLREPVPRALARADAVVLMGPADSAVAAQLAGRRILEARLVPAAGTRFAGPVVAFAGIARPEKFFRTLAEAGARIAARHGFPDHHPYREAELARLAREADEAGASLVTTAKDWVRLAPPWRARVAALEVDIEWQDEAALDALLRGVAGRAHG
jgi:tetraacyldisaccharide 4'-kinase